MDSLWRNLLFACGRLVDGNILIFFYYPTKKLNIFIGYSYVLRARANNCSVNLHQIYVLHSFMQKIFFLNEQLSTDSKRILPRINKKIFKSLLNDFGMFSISASY